MNAGRPGAATRDLRLDFFRGVALFSIFIDHIPNNFLARITLQSFGLSDAAEVFILISGFAAGMIYGRAVDRAGPLPATARVLHRAWQLYVAHIFLFMLFMATVAHAVTLLNESLYADEFHAANFLKEPDVAVIMALTLRFQPVFMNILPLYIVLLLALPPMLLGFSRWPVAVIGASLLLWFAVQFADGKLNLGAYPGVGQRWFFNPLAWQALFYLSAWFGWRSTQGGVAWLANRWLFWLAIIVAVVGCILRVNWTIHVLYDPFPALFAKTLWPLMSKSDLSPLRFVNVLALALLVARLVPPRNAFLEGRIALPFVMCGRHSLHVFCLGILLSIVGHLIVSEMYGGYVVQAVVSVTGVALMIALAALMDWFAATGIASKTREVKIGS